MEEVSVEKKRVQIEEKTSIFREMAMKYGIFSVEEARAALKDIRGKLSDTVIELRGEE